MFKINPCCAICSNHFGITDDQLLFECSQTTCGAQYCKNCVDSIRGPSLEYPFICMTCKKKVTPKRNPLIEKHLIWKAMCKLHGMESFQNLTLNSELATPATILKDIKFRRLHLQIWADAFQKMLEKQSSIADSDKKLLDMVTQLVFELGDITKSIDDIREAMRLDDVFVEDCLKEYQEASKNVHVDCEILTRYVETIEMHTNILETNISKDRKEIIQDLYRMKDRKRLSSQQSITAIDGILSDISFRKECLSSRYTMCKSLLEKSPQPAASIEKYLKSAEETLKTMKNITEKLNLLRGKFTGITRSLKDYDKCLRDEQFQDIPCSKFIILVEQLRKRTEYFENKTILPKVIQLKEEWQKSYGTGDDFKPKVIELFKNIEEDLTNLYAKTPICSIPYKVGIIGDGSVGKSALMIVLADLNKGMYSTVDFDRSTFSYVKFYSFNYKHPRDDEIIPFIFIDLQGATDDKDVEAIGSYMELITKADCDLYIIAFHQAFNEHNRQCKKHIEHTLRRKCILVRTKTDALFLEAIPTNTNERYNHDSQDAYELRNALCEVKKNVLITYDRQRLSDKVYLTAAGCDDELKISSVFTFDMKQLKKDLVYFAIEDTRIERIFKMTSKVLTDTINTCFRRGYIVSTTRYRLAAAACSIIPFGDEVPAYLGREKIRQVFGIHDDSAAKNIWNKTVNSFEEYLREKNFIVPKKCLTSDCFKYLTKNKSDESMPNATISSEKYFQVPLKANTSSGSRMSEATEAVIRGGTSATFATATRICGIVGTALDDVLRIAVPTSSAALRAASIAGIVVGAALIPVFGAWAYYHAGNRMNKLLHEICDDLYIVGAHFIAVIYNNHLETLSIYHNMSYNDEHSSSDEE